MRKLFSSLDQRALKTIEILTFSNRNIDNDYLISALDSSPNTLKNTLDHIRDNFPFLEIKAEPYYKIYYDNSTIHTVYSTLLNNDDSFKIIKMLLTNQQLDICDLKKALSLSSSSIYRRIASFNKIAMDKYGFKINTSPMELSGREESIRSFYATYLRESDFSNCWSDFHINKDLIENFVDECLTYVGYEADFNEYLSIMDYVTVSLARIKAGYHIDMSNKGNFTNVLIKTLEENIQADRELASRFEYYSHKMGFNVGIDTAVEAFYPYLQDSYVANREEYSDFISNKKEAARAKAYLHDNLKDITQESGMEFIDIFKLIKGINNAIALRPYNDPSAYILDCSTRYFILNVRNKLMEPLNDIREVLTDYLLLLKVDFDEDFLNYIEEVCYYSINGLLRQINMNKIKLKALIIGRNGLDHSKLIKDELEPFFSDDIVFDLYPDHKLDYDYINEQNYDIIISSMNLGTVLVTEFYYVPDIPLKRDIFNLVDKIFSYIEDEDSLVENSP